MKAFTQLMERIEVRLAADAQLLRESGKLIKKATVQLNQVTDHGTGRDVSDFEVPQSSESNEVVEYNGVNLMALGGINDSDECKRVVLELFQPEGLKKYVIDPRRAAMSRDKADQERTDLFKKAVKAILGSRYSESRYEYHLKLVNQIGLNMRDDVDKSKENGAHRSQQEALTTDHPESTPSTSKRYDANKVRFDNKLPATRSGRLGKDR